MVCSVNESQQIDPGSESDLGPTTLMSQLCHVWRNKSLQPSIDLASYPEHIQSEDPIRSALSSTGHEFKYLSNWNIPDSDSDSNLITLQLCPGRGNKRVLNRPITQVFLPRIRPPEMKEDWSFLNIKEPQNELLLEWKTAKHFVKGFFQNIDQSENQQEQQVQGYNNDQKTVTKSDKLSIDSVKILANLHPIAPLHALLLPPGKREQFLTLDSLFLAMLFNVYDVVNSESDKSQFLPGQTKFRQFFRLTFNAMGAGASVNHQHWQIHGWPWTVCWDGPGVEKKKMQKEMSYTKQEQDTAIKEILCSQEIGFSIEELRKLGIIILDGGIENQNQNPTLGSDIDSDDIVLEIYRAQDGKWPLSSMFEFRLRDGLFDGVKSKDKSEESSAKFGIISLRRIIAFVHCIHTNFIQPLQEANITHNVTSYISQDSKCYDLRLTLAIRDFFCPQSENPNAIGVASLESIGHWILPSEEVYNDLTTEKIYKLYESLSISDEQLEQIWGWKLG